MEVILREDVPKLGKVGDVKKVSDGFARNYLIPQKKAMVADKGSLKRLEQEQKVIEARRAKAKQEAEALGQKISSITLTVEKQAGEEDKIFGTVSSREVADLLDKQGIKVDKRTILIKDAIRKLGEYSVEIHLHSEVVASLKLVLIKK
ncbi:MAG: 50S ribosomal protein L9 [Deltaproteobacteria bacterium]|nr:MAG: 50S ribosomal protein L9 [Deltaproteobacteria bacterium]